MSVCFALVHHPNQYLINDIVGSEADGTGILAVLGVHEADAVPLNLHISGTLLEAPKTLRKISIDCGLSSDYLALLRQGSEIVTPIHTVRGRGFSANGTSIILEATPGRTWTNPEQECIGHGRTVRIEGTAREFELRLRVEANKAVEEVA